MKNVISNDEVDNEQEISELESADLQAVKKRSVRGVISYTARSFLLYGMSIAAAGALTVFLSPEEFGVYYVVTAVVGLFTFLSDVGLAASLVQKKTTPTLSELRTTFTVQQALSLLIFGTIVALTPYWRQSQGFGATELWLLYSLGASFFLASLKTIPSILLERRLRFDLLVIPALFENAVFHGITVFLAWRGYGIASYTYAIFLRGVIGVIVLYALQRWPIGFGFSREHFRSLLRYGAGFQLNDLLARIKDDLLIVVLGMYIAKDQMGYIAWAKKWTQFPQQFSINNVMEITFPTFSRLQHDETRLQKAIEKTLYFIALTLFPLLAGMSLFLSPLLSLFTDLQKWQPAVLSFILFCVNIAWSAVSTPLTNTLNAIGHIKKTVWLMMMWTVLTWVLTPVAVLYFGYTGVAIASAAIGVSSLVTVYLVKKIIPLRVWPQVWRPLLATFVMILSALPLLTWSRASLLHLVAVMAFAGLLYTGTFLLVGWKSLMSELRSLGILS